MWRFRTEDEFIRDFGPHWKNKINSRWNSDGYMDHLLGWTPHKKDQHIIETIMEKGVTRSVNFATTFRDKKFYGKDMNWTYSKDMFVKVGSDFGQLEFDF